jgi:predicted unusual protein kinase regulating ubiquinone biosynthesis (AarF/ABC1/UbiB family)
VERGYQGIYQAAFAKLRDNAPPMPASLAEEVVAAELGRSPARVFAEFDPNPVAAASIGQVHRAVLADGRQVAVKVRYPGVADAIRADLANTELLATFLGLLLTVMPSLARLDVSAVAAEIAERIGEEIDYQLEAASQQLFADAHRGHPFIRVPEVVPELTTRRVLTMDFVDGLRYAEAVQAPQHLRDSWGEVIYRFTYDSMWRLGVFNTDPHPGNYLFHPDGTVTFLDFGCVKRLTGEQARTRQLVSLTLGQDPELLHRWTLEQGWLDPTDPPTGQELLEFWSDSFQYLLGPQPFSFTRRYTADVLRARLAAGSRHHRVNRAIRVPATYTLNIRTDLEVGAVLGGLRTTELWKAINAEYDDDDAPATSRGEQQPAFLADHRCRTTPVPLTRGN